MIFALPPLVAEPIFNIGSFPVTNAYINSCLAVVFFFVIGFMLRNKTAMVPKGLQNFGEATI
jgi:F0F1-type ATP synthase membrane subunit a